MTKSVDKSVDKNRDKRMDNDLNKDMNMNILSAEFEYFGKRLFNEGLVGGNFGNMSQRCEDGFYITKSGSYLDECEELKKVREDGTAESGASSEWRVHHAAYLARPDAFALVHAHPAHAVAASYDRSEIIPIDSEGKMLCPVIPIVEGEPGTDDLAQNVAAGLKRAKVVIARAHGTFAIGKDMKEAYLLTSIAEHACKITYLQK